MFASCIAVDVDLLTSKLVGFDLAAYILGARRLLGGAPLYQSDVVGLGPFGQYVYPPPVAGLFVPLALLPFDAARLVGLFALVGMAGVLTWALVRRLPLSTRYWAAAAIVLFFPLVWEVSLENLTLATLLLCLLAWRLRRSDRRAGLALAAALGLKLLPIALVAFLLAAGRRRMVGWALLALGAVTAASLPFLGEAWVDYLAVLGRLASAPPGVGSNIVPLVFATPALRPLLPALALLVALACGLAVRREPSVDECAFRVALAVVPLFASTLWYPYLVFALPLLVSIPPSDAPPALSRSLLASRALAWLVMQAQLIREPGRDFLLPLAGLLFLVGVGLVELLAAVRSTRAGIAHPVAATATA